jgi:hypothetical protein
MIYNTKYLMDQRSFSVPRASRPEFHAEPRFVKTEEIPVADLAKIRRLSAEAVEGLRDEQRGSFSPEKYRSMLMSVLLGLASTSVLPHELREELMNAEIPVHPQKTHVELGPGGTVEVVPDTDREKQDMTRNDLIGRYARTHARRQPMWEAYTLDKVRPEDLVSITETTDPVTGWTTIRGTPNSEPILQNIQRMPEGPFLDLIRIQTDLEIGMILKQKDLPQGEMLEVVLDRAFERAVRRALMGAKQRGIQQGGFMQADNQAMIEAMKVVIEFTQQHRGEHSTTEMAGIIQCITDRAEQKRFVYARNGAMNDDQGASLSRERTDRFAVQATFDLFSSEEEVERETWVRARMPDELMQLLGTHSDWFLAHIPQLLHSADVAAQERDGFRRRFLDALQEYQLQNPDGDHHTRRNIERMERVVRMSEHLE